MSNSQLAQSTQNESCCISRQVEGVSNGPSMCRKSVWCCLVIYRDKSRWKTCRTHIIAGNKKYILRRKGHRVLFVSRHPWDLIWNIRQKAGHVVQLAWLLQMKWLSKRRYCFVQVDQAYQPWHQRHSLPPCGPYLATSNILRINKVNTKYNGLCSEKEPCATSGR